MEYTKVQNKGSARLFVNPILERLTRTVFIFPVIFYFLLGICSVVTGFLIEELNPLKLLYLFPAGMIIFSLVEYLIHRFVFHFHAETESEKKIQYTIHGVHHHFPKDKDRLVMPPLISIFLAAFFFFLFYFLFGSSCWFLYGGFVSGYSVYLIIHYAVHRYHPPKNFLKILWKHHALHHYKADAGYYSVSFPVWDYLFGTAQEHEPASVKNKKTY